MRRTTGQLQKEILDALREAKAPITVDELACRTNSTWRSVRAALESFEGLGFAERVRVGKRDKWRVREGKQE